MAGFEWVRERLIRALVKKRPPQLSHTHALLLSSASAHTRSPDPSLPPQQLLLHRPRSRQPQDQRWQNRYPACPPGARHHDANALLIGRALRFVCRCRKGKHTGPSRRARCHRVGPHRQQRRLLVRRLARGSDALRDAQEHARHRRSAPLLSSFVLCPLPFLLRRTSSDAVIKTLT